MSVYFRKLDLFPVLVKCICKFVKQMVNRKTRSIAVERIKFEKKILEYCLTAKHYTM